MRFLSHTITPVTQKISVERSQSLSATSDINARLLNWHYPATPFPALSLPRIGGLMGLGERSECNLPISQILRTQPR